MPRKSKSFPSKAPLAPIPSEILDQFEHQGPLTPEELDTVVRRFKKAIIERALGGELTHHLGYTPAASPSVRFKRSLARCRASTSRPIRSARSPMGWSPR